MNIDLRYLLTTQYSQSHTQISMKSAFAAAAEAAAAAAAAAAASVNEDDG